MAKLVRSHPFLTNAGQSREILGPASLSYIGPSPCVAVGICPFEAALRITTLRTGPNTDRSTLQVEQGHCKTQGDRRRYCSIPWTDLGGEHSAIWHYPLRAREHLDQQIYVLNLPDRATWLPRLKIFRSNDSTARIDVKLSGTSTVTMTGWT